MQTFSHIDKTEIEAAKTAASALGYKISYRDREGKQYLNVSKIDKTFLGYEEARNFIKPLFPSALVTSFGLTATFRINP